MSDVQRWEEQNATYLERALAWLRLSLTRLGQQADGAPGPLQPTTAPVPAEQTRSFFGRRRPEAGQPSPPLALPPPDNWVSAEQVAAAAAELAEAAAGDPPPAAINLQQRLGLTGFELEVLLLCAALELDTRIAGLCGYAQGDPAKSYPTFALGMALSEQADWAALAPERPLRYYQLIRVHQPGAAPLTASALSADERIVNYLKGLNYLDDRLHPLAVPFSRADEQTPAPSQQEQAAQIGDYVAQVEAQGEPPIVQLLGPDSEAKQLVARQVAAQFGLLPLRLPAELLPTQIGELEQLIRLWQRERLLLPLALFLDAQEFDRPTGAVTATPLNRLLRRAGGLIFLDVRDAWPGLGDTSLVFDVVGPTTAEQQAAWAAALGDAAGEHPERLAGHFRHSLGEIQQIARSALSGAPEADQLGERLWAACLLRARPQLDVLAQRIEPGAGWNELVLPAAELATLHQIADQVGRRTTVYQEWGFGERLNRGLGISALFAGPSGTGKTMAAEVIARELQLNLYRIDLSQVVSKYIGETEKNLRRLFDAAERGGVILFFDEADALFGKRSEVKDSHDRYANIEINYLLQRMEAYSGLAILATNMKDALDPAFTRRLRFIVNFPFPGPVERVAMWRKVFPDDVPLGELDWERLGRINLSGGNIVNVALNAAFRAASAGRDVAMGDVLEAARAELRKLDMPIREVDL
jgi:hypothetical protein